MHHSGPVPFPSLKQFANISQAYLDLFLVEDIQTLALRKSDLLVNACFGESSSHNCVIFLATNYGKLKRNGFGIKPRRERRLYAYRCCCRCIALPKERALQNGTLILLQEHFVMFLLVFSTRALLL
jgi:hypothetical protein